MGDDPGFIFYPGDYLRDTQCLSEKSQVAYDRIMCEHMRNICISQAQLKFFTKKLSDEEIEELKMVLVETAEGFYIEWVHASILKRRAYSESRRENRTKKTKNTSSTYDGDMKTYVEHMENENEIENREREKRGVGKKEREGPSPPSETYENNFTYFDVEKLLLEHRKEFEAILMKTRKTEIIGLEVLRKYHLWLTKRQEYPMAKTALFAGFELFLRNEKNYSDGGIKGTSTVGKHIRFDKP